MLSLHFKVRSQSFAKGIVEKHKDIVKKRKDIIDKHKDIFDKHKSVKKSNRRAIQKWITCKNY